MPFFINASMISLYRKKKPEKCLIFITQLTIIPETEAIQILSQALLPIQQLPTTKNHIAVNRLAFVVIDFQVSTIGNTFPKRKRKEMNLSGKSVIETTFILHHVLHNPGSS
jgi:hypothetical protein